MDKYDHLFEIGQRKYRARLLPDGVPDGPAIALYDGETDKLIARLTYPDGPGSDTIETFGGEKLALDTLPKLRYHGELFIA